MRIKKTELGTYKFLGWANLATGKLVASLDSLILEISEDMELYPVYDEVEYNDYRLSYTFDGLNDYSSSIKVSVGGESVDLYSTYHYGSSVKIKVTPRANNEVTEFKVRVGAGAEIDALTFANRVVEEDGTASYEIEVTANGNIAVTYNEHYKEFDLKEIPSRVTIKRNNKELSADDKIYYGDELEITYEPSTGHHKTEFNVNGAAFGGGIWKVEGDVTVTYNEAPNMYSISVPDGVAVTRGGETLTSLSEIYYGDELTLTYTETSTRYTGNTKQENGYNYRELETTTYTANVNGQTKASGSKIIVEGNVLILLNPSTSLSWEQASRIEYSVGTIPDGVTITRNGVALSNNAVIYYGDELTLSYTETSTRYTGNTKQENGYNYRELETTTYVASVNEQTKASGSKIIVEGNVSISLNPSTSLSFEQASRIEYSVGTIPDGVTVTRNSVALSNNAVIYYGDELTISYTETSTRYTGNTKQENGYNYRELETTTYTATVNGQTKASGSKIIVEGNVLVSLNPSTSLSFEQASRIEYSVGTIPDGVTVTRNGTTLSSNAVIYYGDELTITSTLGDDYNITEFKVNGEDFESGSTHTVTGNVNITFAYEDAVPSPYSYLTFTECDGGYEVSAFNKTSGVTDVVIPATYNGKKVVGIASASSYSKGIFYLSRITSLTISEGVTSIGDYTFYGCNGLTSITIPNSVTSLGDYTFYGCNGLTSITIPNSVTSLGTQTFYGCDGLASVTMGEGVTSIGKSAFAYCKNLTSVTIPSSVTNIGSMAFSGCAALTSVNYLGTINSWAQINFKDSISNPTYYTKKLTIQGQEVTEVNLSGIEKISDYAFINCQNITSIEIPDSVISIGTWTFSGCSGLTTILVNTNNQKYTSRDLSGKEVNCIINNESKILVLGCQTTVIPSDGSVTSIGTAFDGCSGLTSVTIPSSVTSIGTDAFRCCTGLISIEIPSSVTSIRDYTFDGCIGLTAVTIGERVTSISQYAFRGCIGLTSIEIPSSVTYVGFGSFSSCTGLTSITIGKGVTSIGNSAFEGCSKLTSIEVEANNTNYSSLNGVLYNKNKTKLVYYPAGKTQASFEIPTSVTSIGESAFDNCSSLTSVIIGNSVTSIGSYAFQYCSSLTSVTIGNSVTSIGNWVFRNCSNLTSVTIESANIYKAATGTAYNQAGNLLLNATEIRVLATIVDDPSNTNTYLNNTANYTKILSDDGLYYVYTKVSA